MALVITVDSPPFNGEVSDLFTVTGHVREDGVGVPATVSMINTDTGAILGSAVAEADGYFSIAVQPAVMALRAALLPVVGSGVSRRSGSIVPIEVTKRRSVLTQAAPPVVTLYLLSAANGMSNPPPDAATALYTGANLQTAAAFTTLRQMATAIGAGPQTSLSFNTLGQTASQQAAFLRWASPPFVGAGNYINFAAGWMFNFPCEVDNTNVRVEFRRGRCYLWRPSTQAIVKTVYDCFSTPTAGTTSQVLVTPQSYSGGAWALETSPVAWDALYGISANYAIGTPTQVGTARNVGGTLLTSGYAGTYSLWPQLRRLGIYKQTAPTQNAFAADLATSDIQAGDVLVFETVARLTQTDTAVHPVTVKTDGTGTYNTMTGPACLKFWDAKVAF